MATGTLSGMADWQHPQSAFDPNASWMAPRVFGNTLYEHGNQRVLQPDEVPQAQGYVSDFWGQFPTGFQPGVGPQTNSEYGIQPPSIMKPPGAMPDGTPTFDPQWGHMQGGAMMGGGQYGQMTSGGLYPGAMRGAFGAPFNWMGGGGRSSGGVVGRGTLGSMGTANDSSYDLAPMPVR